MAADQDSGPIPSTVMGIVCPHGCFFVGTNTGIVTVFRQAQRVTHLCKGSHPHSLTSPMSLSPWSPHLPVLPTPSHTHRVLGCLSANLEFYAVDHSIFQQARQVRSYCDDSPPMTSILSLPPCWTASASMLAWANLIHLSDVSGKNILFPWASVFSSMKWDKWPCLPSWHRYYQDAMN